MRSLARQALTQAHGYLHFRYGHSVVRFLGWCRLVFCNGTLTLLSGSLGSGRAFNTKVRSVIGTRTFLRLMRFPLGLFYRLVLLLHLTAGGS